jgi:hypothetical protein
MQTIKTVKKHVTTDGMEFLNLETAIEHQKKIESIGSVIEAGDIITYADASGWITENAKVIKVDLPLIRTDIGVLFVPKINIVEVGKPNNE